MSAQNRPGGRDKSGASEQKAKRTGPESRNAGRPAPENAQSTPEQATRGAWILLTAVLVAECAGMLFLLGATVLDTVYAARAELKETVGLLFAAFCGLILVVAAMLGAARRRAWARAAGLVAQILTLAAALGALQGLFGVPLVGVALLVLGAAGLFAALRARSSDHLPATDD
ncbi:MAG: hypothetical protein Q4C71_04230 [Microbacteriaceae bacterium]|nr:hypothetical protein [Microbacteriaceae bacterium]